MRLAVTAVCRCVPAGLTLSLALCACEAAPERQSPRLAEDGNARLSPSSPCDGGLGSAERRDTPLLLPSGSRVQLRLARWEEIRPEGWLGTLVYVTPEPEPTRDVQRAEALSVLEAVVRRHSPGKDGLAAGSAATVLACARQATGREVPIATAERFVLGLDQRWRPAGTGQ